MGTEVLRPSNPLAGGTAPAPAPFHKRRNLHNLPNLTVDKRPFNLWANGPKKTSFSPKPDGRRSRKSSPTSPSPPQTHDATILRWSESSESLAKGGGNFANGSRNGSNNNQPHDLVVSSPGEHKKWKGRRQRANPRGGDEIPETDDDVYAGSAFSLSPSPRSVPLPSFFGGGNKAKHYGGGGGFVGDSPTGMLEETATIGLRRLLRLGC